MDEPPGLVRSPLSQTYTEGEITVEVSIYTHDGIDGWALEVVGANGEGIVWQDVIASDTEAMAEFIEGVKVLGLSHLMDPDPEEAATEH